MFIGLSVAKILKRRARSWRLYQKLKNRGMLFQAALLPDNIDIRFINIKEIIYTEEQFSTQINENGPNIYP